MMEIDLKRNEINRVRKRAEGVSADAYHPALYVPDAAEADSTDRLAPHTRGRDAVDVPARSHALAFHRGLSLWSFKSRSVELLTQGDVGILLKDGRLLPEGMAWEHFSPEKIFASLRAQGVEHLGQLRRVYLEPSGDLSLIRYKSQRPGLLIIPELDSTHGRYEKAEDHYACSNCGNVVGSDHEPLDYCDYCGEPRWTEAVTEAGAGRAQSAKRESAGLARRAG